jgi:transcriptional regulator with XRE-family HTH domain
MSYRMRISDRSRKAGRFVSKVHNEIQRAFVESGLKQQELAQKLGIDRSLVNRRLLGEANLTLRSIADLAWALDQNIKFSFSKESETGLKNEFVAKVEPKLSTFKPVQSSTKSSIQSRSLVDA